MFAAQRSLFRGVGAVAPLAISAFWAQQSQCAPFDTKVFSGTNLKSISFRPRWFIDYFDTPFTLHSLRDQAGMVYTSFLPFFVVV